MASDERRRIAENGESPQDSGSRSPSSSSNLARLPLVRACLLGAQAGPLLSSASLLPGEGVSKAVAYAIYRDWSELGGSASAATSP